MHADGLPLNVHFFGGGYGRNEQPLSTVPSGFTVTHWPSLHVTSELFQPQPSSHVSAFGFAFSHARETAPSAHVWMQSGFAAQAH